MTPERRHWCCFGVFIVNFEHISHPNLFLLLTLSKQMSANGSSPNFASNIKGI